MLPLKKPGNEDPAVIHVQLLNMNIEKMLMQVAPDNLIIMILFL